MSRAFLRSLLRGGMAAYLDKATRLSLSLISRLGRTRLRTFSGRCFYAFSSSPPFPPAQSDDRRVSRGKSEGFGIPRVRCAKYFDSVPRSRTTSSFSRSATQHRGGCLVLSVFGICPEHNFRKSSLSFPRIVSIPPSGGRMSQGHGEREIRFEYLRRVKFRPFLLGGRIPSAIRSEGTFRPQIYPLLRGRKTVS